MPASIAESQSDRHARPAVSTRQLRANRRNATRSTGPGTNAGKAASSRNAVTHGAFVADLLLPGEDVAALLELRRGTYVSQSPQDAVQRELVDRIVSAQWRLRRLRGAERAALVKSREQLATEALDEPRPTPGRAALARGLAELQDKGLWPRSAPREDRSSTTTTTAATTSTTSDPPPIAPGEALARDFTEYGWGVVDNLSRCQQRLEQSVHRALRELRLLRKDQRDVAALPPCPYLEEFDAKPQGEGRASPDEEPVSDGAGNDASERCQNVPSTANVQNEPISGATVAERDAAKGCERSVAGGAVNVHGVPRGGAEEGRWDRQELRAARGR